MILKNQVEWALHCCAMMAALPVDHHVSTKTLAEFHGVPKEYLSKALQSLSQNGIITGTLGPAGGYRLARAPKDISFLDVVEAIEGRRSTFQCTDIRANNPCRPSNYCDKNACAIARTMWAADEAWRDKLRSINIEQLGQTIVKEVPTAQLQNSIAWIMEN